jgi:thioredoxin 1
MSPQTRRITDREFRNQLRDTDDPIAVVFGASWSDSSEALIPELRELFEARDYRVIELDVEENYRLANEYAVSGLPSVFIHLHGNLMGRAKGVRSTDEIRELIERVEQYN